MFRHNAFWSGAVIRKVHVLLAESCGKLLRAEICASVSSAGKVLASHSILNGYANITGCHSHPVMSE